RVPATLTLVSVRGRRTAPPSRVPTASPHSRHDSSTHLVRRIRAPRSTSLVDITSHRTRLAEVVAVGELPTVPRTLVPVDGWNTNVRRSVNTFGYLQRRARQPLRRIGAPFSYERIRSV